LFTPKPPSARDGRAQIDLYWRDAMRNAQFENLLARSSMDNFFILYKNAL
jgi:hypothetical protein